MRDLLFFVEWEAGISITSKGGISCFYGVGMQNERDTAIQFLRDLIN